MLLLLPLLLYSRAQWQRPQRLANTLQLFVGITYQRQIHNDPRPQVIHIVTIDLTTPGLEVVVSPGSAGKEDRETTALTTSEFLKRNNLQLAVNANFFYPFEEKTPWNFYPHAGDSVNLLGIAMANGETYSPPEAAWPALCFDANNRAQIVADGTCPGGTQQAIAGLQQLVSVGQPLPSDPEDKAYGRVVAAVNQAGDRLWLIVVDGKQPYYSEGATLAQLTQTALDLGADAALNLDGGGSTTLVMETLNGSRLLNAAIHTKLPGRERPVANQLGFRADPLE